ncbi:MAG: primosomal protein N' [Acidobacteriota bacterium]
MNQRVAVAVPVPVHHTFTYLWSRPDVEPRPGLRVRVPFGRRHLTGLVVGLEENVVEGCRLRPVSHVVDEEPILPKALLSLAAFVSRYYLAPIGEVCRAMLPAGMGPSGQGRPAGRPVQRMALLAVLESEYPALCRRLRRAPAQLRALETLRDLGGTALVDRLVGRGVSTRTLGLLEARGWIRVETISRQPATVQGLPQAMDEVELSASQQEAVGAIREAVLARREACLLLHGVTGSGKTEVYLQAAATALAGGRSALILVPEIGLTPALVARLNRRFGRRLAVLHSGLSRLERRAHWYRIRQGEATIVVGARSAIFAPLKQTGLIVIDEEQDSSYKQEDSPRYQARDLGIMRGRIENCPVLLVSATPSMESYARAAAGKSRLLVLSRRVKGRSLPGFEIVDLRQEFRDLSRRTLLSNVLLQALEETHRAGGQSMLILNRRGWAAFLLCRACGRPVSCRDCSISLTLHLSPDRLLCHYCGFARAIPSLCPDCGEDALQQMGAGTERIEEEVRQHLPALRLIRMDADSVRKAGGHAPLLRRFAAGQADLLLGTQMIAKGHDFPGVTLVGILGGDSILGMPDFRAAEWTFHLATQAAGRAGRGNETGRVILQAFRADHYALRRAEAHDYAGFFAMEDRFRRALLYPPHAVLAAVRIEHPSAEAGAALAALCAGRIREDPESRDHLRILGPAPAPLARLRGRYRFHLLLKAQSRSRLGAVLERFRQSMARDGGRRVRLSIDVDPVSIM